MSGVQLQLDDAAGTFAWLSRGVSMATLGHQSLPGPLSRVAVMVRATDKTAALAALIFSPLPSPGSILAALTGSGPRTMRPPYADLEAAFRSRRTDTALYVLRPDGRKAFGVVPGPLPNQITVFCGDLPLLEWTTPPLKLSDVDAFRTDVALFSDIVATAAAGLYRASGATPPDVIVHLRPGSADPDSVAREAAGRVSEVFDRMSGRGPVGTTQPVTKDRPAERFADVGGQEEAVRELQGVLLALASPERYRQWGARAPKGVLMYGPPGTGKTLLARCLAGEAGATFLHVRAADVSSKWYGEAEQRMQSVFEQARQASPAIIFFDEIDALAPERDGAHEVTHRVVSTLLEHMDGLEELQGVVVIAATNRPSSVDPALLRPGRFDRLIEVGLPGPEGRQQILAIHCRAAERRAGRSLFGELDWVALREASEGLSGAELAEAVRRALEVRVRAEAPPTPVTSEELLRQINQLRERAF